MNVSEVVFNLDIIFILLLLLHMKMKKMLVWAFLWMFAVAGIAVLPNYASAGTDWSDPDAAWNYVTRDWDQKLTWSALLDTIKNAVNWILGILATVALIICLYGWFLMVTSAGDDKKYGNWLNVLKNAAIGLAIIWLSWMIVSVVFWFVNTLWHTTWSDKQDEVDVQSWVWTSTQEYGNGWDTDTNQGNYNGNN